VIDQKPVETPDRSFADPRTSPHRASGSRAAAHQLPDADAPPSETADPHREIDDDWVANGLLVTETPTDYFVSRIRIRMTG